MTLSARFPRTICGKYILQSKYPWQEHKLLSSPRKLNQKRNRDKERGEGGGKLCQLKISLNLTSEFYFHSHHPNLRHTVSSLKDYNDILTGLMVFFLAPIEFILHTAVSGAVHRYNLIALLLQ